jgi:hypothetical protein
MFQSNPYMLGTGTPYMDPLTGMKPIARQVTKRGLLGRPKRYTDIYSIPGSTASQGDGNIIADGNTLIFPDRKSKGQASLTLLDNPHGDRPERQHTNVDGLGLNARMAIRHGERQMNRNDRRLARHPELLESSPSSKITEYPRQEFTGTLINTSGPRVTEEDIQMAYGGYLPKANNGITINNPNLPQPAPANPDLASGSQPGLIGNVTQGPNSVWSQQQSFNAPAPTSAAVQSYNNDPMNNMPVEPLGDDLSNCTEEQKKDSTSKCYKAGQGDKLVGVNYGRMKSKTTDPEAMVNVFNAGVRGITGLLNRKDEKIKERQMYDNLTSDNLYAAQGTKHRGDWVDVGSQMGQYRFDQMGQDRSGFSSYGKYGGFMQDGGEMGYLPDEDYSDDYNEGDEVYMTDEDIRQFMAKGGQIEYI